MTSHSDIGKFIRVLQAERGMTNEQLAKEMGVSRQTVTNWRNANDMKLSVFVSVLNVLGAKPGDFFN
jgi:transcriptional regulator with XRE-family HTH domain